MKIIVKSDRKQVSFSVNPVTHPIENTGDYGAIAVEGDVDFFKDILEIMFVIPASDAHSLVSGSGTYNDLIAVLNKLEIPFEIEDQLPQSANDRKTNPLIKPFVIY